MRRQRVIGRCELVNQRGQSISLPREQYETVRAAWLKGSLYVDVVDFHGARGTVKLHNIESIFDVSPEALMARIEEDRLDEADDNLAGGSVS